MKKITEIFIAFLLCAVLSCVAVSATTVSGTCGEGVSWTFDCDTGIFAVTGAGAMTNYSSGNTPWESYKLIIKDVRIGDEITKVGNNAFYGCISLEKVTLGKATAELGQYSFNDCGIIEEFVVGDATTTIGSWAFDNTDVPYIVIPDSVTAVSPKLYDLDSVTEFDVQDTDNKGYYDIDGVLHHYDDYTEYRKILKYPRAKELKGEYTIQNGVMEIGENCFISMNALEKIVIPDTTTIIGNSAFQGCTALSYVHFGRGVQKLGTYVFEGCKVLTEISIGDAMTTIGSWTFDNTAIQRVIVPETVTNISPTVYNLETITEFDVTDDGDGYYDVDGVLHHYDDYTEYRKILKYPRAKKLKGEYTIQNGVMEIGENCFISMNALEKIVIPDTTTIIGNSAFQGCTALSYVHFGRGVQKLGTYVFEGCKVLTEIRIGDAMTTIGSWTFDNTAIQRVIVPETVTNISPTVYNLETITEFDVTDDGDGYYDIDGVLHHYDDYKEYRKILKYPRAKKLKGEYTIQNGVMEIGENCFISMNALEKIVIPDTTTIIGNSAFQGCTALSYVHFGRGVQELGTYVFEGCKVLTEISIGDAMTTIGSWTFDNTAIQRVIVPETVTNISPAVYNLETITEFDVTDDGDGYYDVDGVLFYHNDYTGVYQIVKYPRAKQLKGTYRIPNGIKEIVANCFVSMSELDVIYIPDTVTKIESSAFQNCTSLKSAHFGCRVSSIGTYTFNGCSSLMSAYFYGGPPSVGAWAFDGCPSALVMYYLEGQPWTTPQWNGFNTALFTPESVEVPVEKVELSKNTATMVVGDKLTLKAIVTPFDATDPTVIWDSSNRDVAIVTAGGVVKALAAGETTITVITNDGDYSDKCTVTVLAEAVPAPDTEVFVTLGDATGRLGETVYVDLSIESSVAANSYSFSDLVYDETVLSFVGFTDYDEVAKDSILCQYDDEKQSIVLGFEDATTLNGSLGKIAFRILSDATEGTYRVGLTSTVKNSSDVIPSETAVGSITVKPQFVGDISGDNKVDIDDAIALFRHIMLPEVYTIQYADSTDFNRDGNLDLKDALYLFQYSMLPEKYPMLLD